MRRTLSSCAKRLLVLLGMHMSQRMLWRFYVVVNYMRLGRWMSDQDFRFPRRASCRDGVFASVADIVRDQKVLYLEFGVFEGASMRFWSRELRHPESCLHGFDSFEGLPEDFDVDGPYVRGTFSTKGAVPLVDDRRVRFFKGWFEEVLPTYEVPEHDVLVLNMDADLYSSTIFVLRHLRPHIKSGTFVYFDDMSRVEHEPRAFEEFMRETGLAFSPVCAEQTLNRAFFRCDG